MASKGHGNGQHKNGKKGTNNLPTGQYTAPPPPPPPPPPPVTTTLPPATTTILPPPRANILLPNTFFMPPPPHQFQPSSPHNSLHSISSSVPSISSTPSLSGLRIEGSITSTSPSIDSDIASNATTPTSLILRFKEVVEINGNGRLIITRDGGNGFIFVCSGRHMIMKQLNHFTWNRGTKSALNSCHENEIQRIFKFKAALRIKEHLYEAQKNLKKPSWMNTAVWDQFLEKWDTLKFRARREWAKENINTQYPQPVSSLSKLILFYDSTPSAPLVGSSRLSSAPSTPLL
ncbi:hypothetical protein P3S67_023772 [Capsicum chacoense]